MEISVILSLLIEIMQHAPQLKQGAEDVISGAERMWDGLSKNQPPSDVQLAQYDAALKAAHDALQRS